MAAGRRWIVLGVSPRWYRTVPAAASTPAAAAAAAAAAGRDRSRIALEGNSESLEAWHESCWAHELSQDYYYFYDIN